MPATAYATNKHSEEGSSEVVCSGGGSRRGWRFSQPLLSPLPPRHTMSTTTGTHGILLHFSWPGVAYGEKAKIDRLTLPVTHTHMPCRPFFFLLPSPPHDMVRETSQAQPPAKCEDSSVKMSGQRDGGRGGRRLRQRGSARGARVSKVRTVFQMLSTPFSTYKMFEMPARW